MVQKKKIFYIEDELSLGKIVKDTLENQGYEVYWEADGARVIPGLSRLEPDVCVLDIMLPNIDGYSLCKTIRGLYPRLPVLFLTAKTTTSDLVKGFESGGTDYIKKPFSIEELIARIENQLRLTAGLKDQQNEMPVINIGNYCLHQVNYELHSPTKVIKLSNREMQLLKLLSSNRNRVCSRKDLLFGIWGDDSYFNSRTLDVYIRKLRSYFSEDQSISITTLKGNGYLFLVP
jgi:DNA-binding response OmpR family regulator